MVSESRIRIEDNWDRHWTDFSAASAFSPATHYRHRLAFRLLAIGPRDKSVRMLEIGSGVDEFAEQFLERLPNSRFLGGN